MTAEGTSTSEPPVPRRGRPPAGERARWEIVYDAMTKLELGASIGYDELGTLLSLDPQDARDKQKIAAASRKAVDQLRQRAHKVAVMVRGQGFMIAEPEQVLMIANRHQKRAVTEIENGHHKVETIDLDSLDVTTRRLVEATVMGFARQEHMMRQFDVRQQRLEETMAEVAGTAQNAALSAAATSTRVAATETEIARLQNEIDHLKSTKDSS